MLLFLLFHSATAMQLHHVMLLCVMILFLGSTLFLISSFRAMSPFLGSLCYAYHHYFLILGPLTFTVCAL